MCLGLIRAPRHPRLLLFSLQLYCRLPPLSIFRRACLHPSALAGILVGDSKCEGAVDGAVTILQRFAKSLTVTAQKKKEEDADPKLALGPKPWFPNSFYCFKLENIYLEATRHY